MTKIIGILLALTLLFTTAAAAVAAEALVGYYKDHTGASIQVVVLNNDKARIDMDEDVYFLLDGQNIWVISSLIDDEWDKIDFVARSKAALSENPAVLNKYTQVSVKDTGYTKTVAGYEGKTFEALVKGTGEAYSVVVSDDKDVARLSKVIMVLFQDLNKPVGGRDVVEIINTSVNGNYGILNLDRELTLQKVERLNCDESYFAVPAGLK